MAWELPRTRAVPQADYAARWHAAVDAFDQRDYPTIRRLVDPLTTVATDAQFEGGIDRLIRSTAPGRASW